MGCKLSGHYTYKQKKTSCDSNSTEKKAVDINVNNELKQNFDTSTVKFSGPFVYDVNISCHEKQLDWVETYLLPLLEDKLKLRCFLYERDRPAGASFTSTARESILHSRKTIVCFSPEYLQSFWKQFEAVMAHHIDLFGKNKSFIPLILKECNLPAKYQGLSMLRWPGTITTNKSELKLKFFWDKLFKSLEVTVPFENFKVS